MRCADFEADWCTFKARALAASRAIEGRRAACRVILEMAGDEKA
ncbi:hypothetical protein [Tateyamaria sp.]